LQTSAKTTPPSAPKPASRWLGPVGALGLIGVSLTVLGASGQPPAGTGSEASFRLLPVPQVAVTPLGQ